MIKIKCINGSPEKELPKDIFGMYCDGNFYNIFESEDEKNQYELSISKPEIVKYREVAAWKVKGILKVSGLVSTIENAFSQFQEPTKTFAEMAWQQAETFNQYSETVQMIKQICNLSDEDLQSIFDQAEQINI